jgi:hypothetical protein
VESALVIIPLVLLFLIAMQLIATILTRNSAVFLAQADATQNALSHVITSDDEVIDLGSAPSVSDLALVISHRRHGLPVFVGGNFSGISETLKSRAAEVTGLAVMEPENR